MSAFLGFSAINLLKSKRKQNKKASWMFKMFYQLLKTSYVLRQGKKCGNLDSLDWGLVGNSFQIILCLF